MEFRHAVAMFLASITGVFAWLAWIFVAGLAIGAILDGRDPRASMNPVARAAISAVIIIFVLALPAFVSARIAARVAARRTGSMDVARVSFLMALTMEIILVVAFSVLFLTGGP